ncbi:MAG: glycoside hydrolase family 38 N-terminal domain-containing protein, partial [Thermoguttaceae bacterium]
MTHSRLIIKIVFLLLCGGFGAALGFGQTFAAQNPAQSSGKEATVQPKLTVINIGSHCDWSWRHTRAWHESRYAEMIRDYLAIMRQDPNFVWQFETVNEQLSPFLAKAQRDWPELIDEFWKGVEQGRIEVKNGYSNPRLSEVYPELFVRDLVLGKEFFRRHVPSIKQEVFAASDLMCGSSQTPQILALAGYRYFIFSRPVGQHAMFWRNGLDGTRMLTCTGFYGYPALQGTPGKSFHGIRPLPIWRYPIGTDDMLPEADALKREIAAVAGKKTLSTMLRFFQECEKYSDQITELS